MVARPDGQRRRPVVGASGQADLPGRRDRRVGARQGRAAPRRVRPGALPLHRRPRGPRGRRHLALARPGQLLRCPRPRAGGNVLAFKVVNGRRDDLAPDGRATDFEIRGVKSRDWRTLRVDFAGAEFRVSLDGRRLFTVRDGALAGPGAVGCWSKADSVTEFERFEYGAT